MLVTWVPKKGVHRDDDGHNQASVCWADRVLLAMVHRNTNIKINSVPGLIDFPPENTR